MLSYALSCLIIETLAGMQKPDVFGMPEILVSERLNWCLMPRFFVLDFESEQFVLMARP